MFILNKVAKSFGDKKLFEDINLTIYDGERIGIIGANGTGKSTFVKLLAGDVEPDYGTIKQDGECSYVKQEAEKSDIEKGSKEEIVNFYKINNELSLNNCVAQSFETMSGGEQTKQMLSFALSKNSKAILLDEPTNNLDQESVEWLIEKLKSFKGTIIVVSHDRYFLDKVVDKILEFENGKVNEFYGNYSSYEIQKQEKLDYDKKIYQEKVAENKKIQGQIQKLSHLTAQLEKSTKKDGSSDRRAKGYKDSAQRKVKKVAKQAEAKRNKLEKLQNDLGDKPFEQKEIFYRINSEQMNNKVLIKLNDVSKKYNNKTLFKTVDLTIQNGEKIALVGKNGSGKSTLIKMILNEESYDGNIWRCQNIKFAYLPQNAFNMQSEQTVIEFASEFNEFKTQFLTNLCNMGFNRSVFSKKISNLSSGEKMKLKLNELILGDFNFLILDEPTNNLDIQNKLFLERVLNGYKGNLIIVSHDVALINNVCSRKVVIENETIN